MLTHKHAPGIRRWVNIDSRTRSEFSLGRRKVAFVRRYSWYSLFLLLFV